MRKVIYSINLSIDGNCEHTSITPNEEMYEFVIDYLRDVDLIVYGRKTYELMIPYWPDVAKSRSGSEAANEFADKFSVIERVVFSKTLEITDENTRIVRDNLKDEILRLKQQPGKNISIGSVSLCSQLTELGLIDEYYFIIHPVIAGEGRHLFADIFLQEKIKLKLIDAKVFKSGCLGLHYVRE
jgi:dihydrofolate reductase